MEGHRGLGSPVIILVSIPNFFDPVLVQVRVVDSKVPNLVDVTATDLDGDAVDTCAVEFPIMDRCYPRTRSRMGYRNTEIFIVV
jgi:hypothetical protein